VIRADAGCVRHAPADGASSLISARELKRCSAERRVQRLIGRRVNERACVTRSESRERERERDWSTSPLGSAALSATCCEDGGTEKRKKQKRKRTEEN